MIGARRVAELDGQSGDDEDRQRQNQYHAGQHDVEHPLGHLVSGGGSELLDVEERLPSQGQGTSRL